CFAFAVATWCFMIGGYAAALVGAVQGMICLVSGCVLGIFLTTMAPSLACQRYGLEQIDYCKTAFGQRGSKIILVFYVINQIGWTGLILVMFGNGIRNILRGLGYQPGGWVVGLGVAIGLWLTYLLVTRGVHLLNVSNAFITPGLIVMTIVMMAMLLHRYDWSQIAAAPPLKPLADRWLNYMIVFEWGVASGFSWWGGIGFLTRNTRTRRNAIYPEILQLGLGMALVCCVSLFSSLIVKTDDPTEWMIPIGGMFMGILALVFVVLANVSTTAVQIFACGLALRHLPSLRSRPWRHLVLWSIVPCLPFVFWPSGLYAMGNAFLAYNGTMYAPISGILFADFLLLRRGRLDVWAIFDDDPAGEYHYSRGFHWPALVSVLIGQAIYIYLFNPLTLEARPLFRAFTASLPACLVPGLVYWAWVALARWRAGAREAGVAAARRDPAAFAGLPLPALSAGPGAARLDEFPAGATARRLRIPNI
ncbi:MAG TPA: cytosine permease, partial [Candidatus Polarisedimenticolia bacterium]|nr:cytosine permease [Candidatus Polarisedimenticolia bacterium]